MSAVAQQFLLTLMLKSHICGVYADEAVPIQPFQNSPFVFISIMAKAVTVSLLQGCPQVANDTKMTDKEINFLSIKIHDLSDDILKRILPHSSSSITTVFSTSECEPTCQSQYSHRIRGTDGICG